MVACPCRTTTPPTPRPCCGSLRLSAFRPEPLTTLVLWRPSLSHLLSAAMSSSFPLSPAHLLNSETNAPPAAGAAAALAADDGPGPDCAEIVIVRHGETTWNASRIIQGHLDSDLNEAGRQQAAAVADRLSKENKFSAVYSSDLKRASETAQIICASCNLTKVVVDPALRERNLGDLQGLTLRDAAKLKPKAYKDFLSSDLDKEIPGGGESINQLHKRVTSALEKIARMHSGERVLVVTHGGAIRELYKKALPGKSPQQKVANTSVNIICISDGGSFWTIRRWGDVSHLHQNGYLKDAFGGDRTSG